MGDHYVTIPLDLLRRLAEHTREAAKLNDQRGDMTASTSAAMTAREADEVAMRIAEIGGAHA